MEREKSANILFVCSRNQWRSPTGEKVWKNFNGVNCRSAGTSAKARRRLTASDLQWADFIFVMEQKHKNRIKAQFPRVVTHKDIYVLDIPDEYHFMDPELVSIFEELADEWFE